MARPLARHILASLAAFLVAGLSTPWVVRKLTRSKALFLIPLLLVAGTSICYGLLLPDLWWLRQRIAVFCYFLWIGGMLQGDFGYSFEYQMPVNDLIGSRLFLTILVSFATIMLTWLIGGGKVVTLTVRVFELLGEANLRYAATAALVLMLPAMAALALMRRLDSGRPAGGS